MAEKITAGKAMVDILKSWGVEHIYGIPGGSINSTVDALYESRGDIRFIQVRHEETGAIAASAYAKLTGKVGVCFGSAGPGATHLFNGLYDAQMDHVPVLAIIGQVASTAMNYNTFQELNQNPMFVDVSVYNRTVMTPESLPHVIDEAIRIAYARKGVSVVTIPVDYALQMIPQQDVSTACNHRTGVVMPDEEDLKKALGIIEKAERPVLYAGQGTRGAGHEVTAFADHFSMPIVLSVLAKGIVPDNTKNLMGTAARVSTKPANEALEETDLIVFTGSDFPFAGAFFPKKASFIQIDVDPAKLGRRHATDAAILGDAGTALRRLREMSTSRPSTPFFEACVENRKNWLQWLQGFEERDDMPMRIEPVFKEINRIAEPGAVFVTDVGNCTIHAIRLLDMDGKDQKFTTSGWFATMGYGVPGGIAAKLAFPDRQIFTLNGDGAFSMVMQDVMTQVKYGLRVINIIFSNDSLGFIEAEQEDTKQPRYGVALSGADFAKAAEAMGAVGFSVTRREQLYDVFEQAKASELPVVIDVKVENKRPFPAEAMVLDPDRYSAEEIEHFTTRYEVNGMPTLKELLGRGEEKKKEPSRMPS